MNCNNCNNTINHNDKFCTSCGLEILKIYFHDYCPKCGYANNSNPFCSNCGNNLNKVNINIDQNNYNHNSINHNLRNQYNTPNNYNRNNSTESLSNINQLESNYNDEVWELLIDGKYDQEDKYSLSDLINSFDLSDIYNNTEDFVTPNDVVRNIYTLQEYRIKDIPFFYNALNKWVLEEYDVNLSYSDLYISSLFERYFNFSSHASRRELVAWCLYTIGTTLFFIFLDHYLFNDRAFYFTITYTVITFIPSIALQIRRLNNLRKGWYYIFLALVPLIGQFIFLIIIFQPTKNVDIDNS